MDARHFFPMVNELVRRSNRLCSFDVPKEAMLEAVNIVADMKTLSKEMEDAIVEEGSVAEEMRNLIDSLTMSIELLNDCARKCLDSCVEEHLPK